MMSSITHLKAQLTPISRWGLYLSLSALTLLLSTLLTSLYVSAEPSVLTQAPDARLQATSPHIQRWLERHEQTSHFELMSFGGLSGHSWLKVRRLKGGEVELLEVRDGVSFEGKPLDLYGVSRKVFSGQPPYGLLRAHSYELERGEAKLGAWRLASGEPLGGRGVWVSRTEQSPRKRQERLELAEGDAMREASLTLMSAEELWRSPQAERLSLSTSESLLDHVGLLPHERAKALKSLDWGREMSLNVSLQERRLMPLTRSGEVSWALVSELKVADDQGRVSHQLVTQEGELLSVIVSDQLKVVAKGRGGEALKSRASLLAAKGRLSDEQLLPALLPARSGFERCSAQHNPARQRTTRFTFRLNISEQGALEAVALARHQEGAWSPLERCLAEVFTTRTFPRPVGGAARVRFPLTLEGSP